jgi:mono/diheme cytochrome c family protein
LLENLTLPEYRTRYRTRRELRGRPADDVLAALDRWTTALDASHPDHERHLLEALWVSWGLNRIDDKLLRELLVAKDYRVRSAAVHALRYNGHQIPDHDKLLRVAAQDENGRVRLEAIAAASRLTSDLGLPIVQLASKEPLDDWLKPVYETANATLTGKVIEAVVAAAPTTTLTGKAKDLFLKGAEVYRREGHCITCHQKDGNGLPAAQFPPIAGTKWVQGDEELLIKLTLHGLMGPITVKGTDYRGLVPMTAFKGLSDEEIAGALTYVRNTFGNKAPAVMPETVRAVRDATIDQKGFYQPAELLEQHPLR